MATFDDYRALRVELTSKCDRYESVWFDAIQTSAFEKAAGAEVTESEVPVLLREIRARLASDTIEVGIFGQVKRGKSTLINALVGTKVSSVNVRPETSRPVWVESGKRRSIVLFADGYYEEFESLAEGAERATQRFKLMGKGRHGDVVRVQQFLDIPWLPQGLRLVDTPGLSDPSMIDEYEERTVAELDRVAAAVFMLVSPPGADREEVRLLKTLGQRGIDKVFLVCNFFADVWDDLGDRNAVLDYVRETVLEGAVAGSQLQPREIKLYGVNGKMAARATEQGDLKALEESGVLQLRRDIEQYLTDGALLGMTGVAVEKLDEVRQIILSTLQTRRKWLEDTKLLDNAIGEREIAVSQSHQLIDAVGREIAATQLQLKNAISVALVEPYQMARTELEQANKVKDVETIEKVLQIRAETAAVKASNEFDRITAGIVRDAERRLYDSFGQKGAFASHVVADFRSRLSSTTRVGAGMLDKVDWGAVAISSVVAGAGAGALGATMAGGAGMALIATGPVGWLIGGGIALAIGLIGGAAAGGALTHGDLQPKVRGQISSFLSEGENNAAAFAHEISARWVQGTLDGLNGKRDRYLQDKDRELGAVLALASDTQGRRDAISKVDVLLELLQ